MTVERDIERLRFSCSSLSTQVIETHYTWIWTLETLPVCQTLIPERVCVRIFWNDNQLSIS